MALTVNGDLREAEVWAGESLLTALRDRVVQARQACADGHCMLSAITF